MKNSMIEVCFNFIYPDNEVYNFEYNTTLFFNDILFLNTGDLVDLTELLTKEELNYFQDNFKKEQENWNENISYSLEELIRLCKITKRLVNFNKDKEVKKITFEVVTQE